MESILFFNFPIKNNLRYYPFTLPIMIPLI